MTTPRLLSERGGGFHRRQELRPSGRRWPGAPRPGAAGRVLIVSNRLPATVRVEDGEVRLVPSSGGLATGLRGVHERLPGLWIGWSGAVGTLPPQDQRAVDRVLAGTGARSVPLEADEVAAFYQRYANGALWPVLHGSAPEGPEPADWETYRAINERYADLVAEEARPGDRVWVHDYHLMLVPRLLRGRRPDVRVGFFLHTPFPELAAWRALPQADALLDGMLGADALGFHVAAYASRFARAVEALRGVPAPLVSGAGVLDDAGRPVAVHATPMGIDVDAFAARSTDPQAQELADGLRGDGGPLFVGVDRLDPTKGIPERLDAFGRLLDRRPDLRGRARLVQLAVPSREDVPAYRALKARVETLVERINARHGTADHQPVHYVYGSVDATGLAALYLAADVMLVTPLCDGMNLVAKEFVATRTDDEGVLVLSERAGAAAELRAALQVDPRDPEALTAAYERALDLSPAERRVRMRRLRQRVAAYDVRRWSDDCLARLAPPPAAQPAR
ncbi:trehalose-6-phosphate synthase [Roseisolibacter sp. H3M3-2]|uniref:alpha,alpha-trehalose-phosphate synthase (UDP-forming) n=1 Tax=Roseisolibacter sp. H3M3-2 TaxID=3031323 RepID=UPI0023DA6764|nr:trehalose-6-phosphate synthase [Roseisolibacter sp. H3M3-2]MDF1503504.1 trehalose-6-phosphate synthase [Roseisolibacter sp. H3M3-2]